MSTTLNEVMNRRNEVRDNIMKGFADEDNEDYMLAKGEIELIEKAVYADTPQNRKLGRVGQEYSRAGRSTKGYNSNMSDDEISSHRSAILAHMNKFHDATDKDDSDENYKKQAKKMMKNIASHIHKHKIGERDFEKITAGSHMTNTLGNNTYSDIVSGKHRV